MIQKYKINSYEYYIIEKELILKVDKTAQIIFKLVKNKNKNIQNISNLLILKEKKNNTTEKEANNNLEGNNKEKNNKKNEEFKVYIIKILIMYYNFQNEFKEMLEQPEQNSKEHKLYLINKNLLNNIKENFSYEEIKKMLMTNRIENIISEEENLYSDNTTNKIYEIIKNEVQKKIFSKLSKEQENTFENLDNLIKPSLKPLTIDNKKIKYLDDFDIINEYIFKKIINGKNNISKKEYKHKCIINNNNLIIKCKKNKGYDFDFLLIEKYINNKKEFKTESVILFINQDQIKTHFEKLKNINFQDYKKQSIKPDNKIFDKTVEIGVYFKLNSEKNNNLLDKNSKIIEFLIRLYLYYEKFEKLINGSSEKKEKKFYLINKNWLDKYKKYYLYDDIIKYLLNDTNEKINFEYNKDDIEDLIDSFLKEFKDKIENLNNFNEKDEPYKVKYELDKTSINKNIKLNGIIEYFKDFEIFSEKIFSIFLTALKKNIIDEQDKYISRSCIIIGQKIIIPLKEKDNYLYNICILENNILSTEAIIVLKDISKSNHCLNYMIECNAYILSDIKNLNDNSDFWLIPLNVYKQSEHKKQTKKELDLYNLLFTFVNSENLKNKINLKQPPNHKEKEKNKKIKDYYLININDLMENIDIKNLKVILESNDELQKILNNDKIKTKKKVEKIIKNLDENLKSKINKCLKQTKFDKINNIDCDWIQKGTKQITFFKNFLLLNKNAIDIFKDFNIKLRNKFTCVLGDGKLFIISKNQNTIEIYNNKDNNIDIELIFDIQESYKTLDILKQIKEIGYKKYKEINIFNDSKNDVSPIILGRDNFIGYSYKINKNIKDYALYHINHHLKVIISLYYFNLFLKEKIKENNIFEKYYYLFNIEYLDEYERIFKYQLVKEELKTISPLNSFIDKKIKETDTLTERNIITLINNFRNNEINKTLNESRNHNIIKQDEPNLNQIKFRNNNQNSSLIYYYDKLKLINSKIYKSILSEENYQKNNYSKCIFVEGMIMIKLSEYLNNCKNAYELGELDKNNIFEPKYILIYHKKEYFLPHLEGGMKLFLKSLNFGTDNHLPIYIDNNEIGIILNISIKFKEQEPIPIPKIYKPKYKSIKEIFIYPPLIGLQNVGATCYMNATLQCLCQIVKLVNFFKFSSQITEIETKYKNNSTDCLTVSFKYLIENLWPSENQYTNNKYNFRNSNNKYFAPYEFKNKISEMNPLFKGAQANDSKDLVNFIVMTLHAELNKAKKENNPNINNINIDQTNIKEVFQQFSINFAKENQSIISDLFYGTNVTYTQCLNCKLIKYNFQIYFFLIFPLEEVRKMKINNLKNQFNLLCQNNMMNMMMQQNFNYNIQNINSVNIYDCFEYNQKLEFFTGENAMYCNKCKIQLPASYNTKLHTIPEVLIIVLNRGKGIEFNVKLEFEEQLNLLNFTDHKEFGFRYHLIGVVTHLGESGASGHFIAYCKNPIDQEWYRHNDDLVTKVNNFQKEIIDYAMPYILFFQKNDN